VYQLGPPLAELLEPVLPPQLPFLRYEVLPQLLSVLMEVLGRGPVGELGVQGRRYQGDVSYPGDVALFLADRPEEAPREYAMLCEGFGPSSLVKVLSRSDSLPRQRVV
jgi:hypothetical protein